MGAWGEGVLENDAAVDWLGDLEDQPQIETITIALSVAATGDDYLDADDGAAALVAAEIVAATLGKTKEERLEKFAGNWPELSDHQGLAAEAVERVGDAQRSELTDLWNEDGPNPEWEAVLADLKQRLS